MSARGRAKTHRVLVTIRVDAPITAAQARYAVWNAIDGLDLYGNGRPSKIDKMIYRDVDPEPWGAGKVSVSRSAPKKGA